MRDVYGGDGEGGRRTVGRGHDAGATAFSNEVYNVCMCLVSSPCLRGLWRDSHFNKGFHPV